MSESGYRNYLFSSQEFMVLSACAGMDGIPILFENQPQELGRNGLNRILFQLYQKEILYWKSEESYDLKEEIRCLFRNMKTAGKELQIYSEKNGSPLLCFFGENVVVTELSENDRDTIKIHSLPQSDFFEELCDRGILPEKNPLTEEDTGGGYPWKCPKFLKQGNILPEDLQTLLYENNELTAFMTVYDRKAGETKGMLLILDYGIFDSMAVIQDGCIKLERCTVDRLKSFFTS